MREGGVGEGGVCLGEECVGEEGVCLGGGVCWRGRGVFRGSVSACVLPTPIL